MHKHWKEISVLYTIGIAFVLIGHSHASDWASFEGTFLQKSILFIYTFHWFFQAAMMLLCEKLRFGWVPTFFAMLATGVLGPAVVILVYERVNVLHKKWIKLVLGVR